MLKPKSFVAYFCYDCPNCHGDIEMSLPEVRLQKYAICPVCSHFEEIVPIQAVQPIYKGHRPEPNQVQRRIEPARPAKNETLANKGKVVEKLEGLGYQRSQINRAFDLVASRETDHGDQNMFRATLFELAQS